MKICLSILLLGAVLMSAPAGSAQTTNLMGVVYGNDWFENCIWGPGFQTYVAQVFVQNPVNPDFDGTGAPHPVSWINGFECRLWLEGDAILLGWHFPVNAIDAGTDGNTVVGFAEPVPVVEGRAIVATLEIFLGGTGIPPVSGKSSPLPCEQPTAAAHMAPIRPVPSVPGMLAYLDADDPDDPLVGATPYWGVSPDIVLLMEAEPVATEQQTWGGIKALYR